MTIQFVLLLLATLTLLKAYLLLSFLLISQASLPAPAENIARVRSKSNKKHPGALGDCRAKKENTSSLAVSKECSKIFLEYGNKGTVKRGEIWPSYFKWISRLQASEEGHVCFPNNKIPPAHVIPHLYHPYPALLTQCSSVMNKDQIHCFLTKKQNTTVSKQQTNTERQSLLPTKQQKCLKAIPVSSVL